MMNVYNHRLELITTLLKNGYSVNVAAPYGVESEALIKLGVCFYDIDVENRGTNIKADLNLITTLYKLIKRIKPNVVLTFYTKTNIYGGIAARLAGVPYIENITGLGSALSGSGRIQKLMKSLYKYAVEKAEIVFFQNKSNLKFFQENRLWKGRYELLPGSGVNLERFKPLPYPQLEVTNLLFISRILKEKGIDEILEAARVMKKNNDRVSFHVVGPCEPKYDTIVKKAHIEGLIHYYGKVEDTTSFLQDCHCFVYPSYYAEGMANVLLEAAASGRPLITTNLPGCGETVENDKTGFIVKERDSKSLISAIKRFISLTPSEKQKMGEEGRHKMENEFNRQIVVDAYLKEINHIVKENKK